jgi:hypothetical protein
MKKRLVALSVAAGIGLICCQSAGAVPAAAAALKEAAAAASPVRQAQFAARRTRYGVVKCYRDFVIGPYRCHRYRWW